MTSQIVLPRRGLSERLPFGKHAPETTEELRNFWTMDPRTGREQISQCAGQSKYTATALGAGRVHTLMECIYANPLSLYTNASTVTVENSTTARSVTDVLGAVADSEGNWWYLDGQNGIVKLNHDFVFQFRIALPSVLPGETVRALAVDSAGLVFAGVSSGNDPRRARLWAFEEIEDNKTQLLWEETTGWFTEAIKVTPAGLYCAQNNTETWRSRMALYVGYTLPNPTLLREWDVAYPVNDFDVSPIDGNVATVHPPQVNRGSTPRTPETTAVLRERSLRDLANFGRRARAWHSARDVDGNDTNNANRADGEVIATLVDKTGNGRHWFEQATGKGAVLRKGALANQDVLTFNGTDMGYKGLAGTSTDILFKSQNRGIIPSHKTHQFALFLLVQVPQSNTRSTLFSQNYTTAANVKDRRLMANASFFTTTFQNANGSAFLYEEVPPVAGPAVGAWGRVTASGNNVPLGGAFDAGGLLLFSYIFDHGVDDVTGSATRSTVRCNGRPLDRWTSGLAYETLQASGLMCDMFGSTASNFATGNFLECFVLEDWYESAGGLFTAQTRQRLIEAPTYPDSVWSAGSQTELEWIESVIMSGWGAAHLLPAGFEATLEAVAVVNNNDTVTIDGTVYTFKTTLTGAANEVLRDATTGTQSLRNLHHAINGTGSRGTAYTNATVIHPSVWSPGVLENDGTNGRAALMVQAREPRGTTAGTMAESTAEARLAWIPLAGPATTTSVRSRTASATEPGIYHHPYSLLRFQLAGPTIYSYGAPPPISGSVSIANSLVSPYGLLCLWDATNGRIKNALTTSGSGTQTGGGTFLGLPFGGIGYGVRFLPSGNLICAGPRQASVTVLGTVADNVDLRKVVISDTGFTVIDGATAADSWVANPGAWMYQYPRMDVDPFGNVYVPSDNGIGASMLVYKEVAPNATPGSALILTVDTLTGDPPGRAVAIDPAMPAFLPAHADKRAELVLLATQKAATTNLALHELRLVTVAANTNVPHTVTVRAAGIGSELHLINDDGTHSLIDANAFDANAKMVSWAFAFGKVFITDGTTVPKLWDPATGAYGFWRVRAGGQIPKRPLFVVPFRNRVFAGPLAEEPNVIVATAAGDPYSFNIIPKGDSNVLLAAWHSQLSETTANFPENITCLVAKENDVLVAGAERSIWVLRGDPMQGGQWDMVVKGVGMAFGRPACFTPEGVLYFVSDQGELRRLMPEALASRALQTPPLVSGDIANRLSAGLDFSKVRVELHYDPRDQRLHIALFKLDATDTDLLTHYTYEVPNKAFSDRTYGTDAVQPASMLVISALDDSRRVILMGGHDGYVRFMDPDADSDDGVVITPSMTIPLVPNDSMGERWLFENFNIQLTQDSGPKTYIEFLESNDPDDLGSASLIADGMLSAGRNTPSARISGNYVLLRIKGSATTAQRVAVIEARADVSRMSTEART